MQIEVGGEIIEVPDGLDDAQIDRIVASHVQQRAREGDRTRAAETFSELPAPAKFATGLGAAAAEPVLGLAQAATRGAGALGIPGADRATEALSERVNTVRGAAEGAGGWGTVGELAGFAAGGLASLPRALGRYLPQGASGLQRVRRAAGLGAVEQGAYEGSRATLEGDPSRGQRAATGATGGAAGGAGGAALPSALARVAEPIKTSAPARRLVEWARKQGQQLDLTAGQAAGRGSVLGSLEEGAVALPVVGRAINRQREGSTEVWNQGKLSEIATAARGQQTPIMEAGPAGVRQAQEAVRDAYDAALAQGTLALNPNSFDKSLNAMVRLAPDDMARAEKILENVNTDIHSGAVTGDTIMRIRTEINEAASQAFRQGNYALGRVLREIDGDYRQMVNRAIGPQGQEAMKRADSAYSLLADVNTAAAMQGAVTAGGRFTPSQLINAQRRGEPASMVASGRTQGLSDAVEANRVLGDTLPKPGPGTAEKAATMGVLAAGGGVVADLLAGDDPKSQTLAYGPALAYALLGTRGGARLLTPGAGSSTVSRGRSRLAEALRNIDPRARSIMERAAGRQGARTTEEDYPNAP